MAINENNYEGVDNGVFLSFVPVLGGIVVDNEMTREAISAARLAVNCPPTTSFSSEKDSFSQRIIAILKDKNDGRPSINTVRSVDGILRSVKVNEFELKEKPGVIIRTAFIVLRDDDSMFTIKANISHESGQKLIEKLRHVELGTFVQLSMFGTYEPNKSEPNGKSYSNYGASVKVRDDHGVLFEVKVPAEERATVNENIARIRAMGLSKESCAAEITSIKTKYYLEMAKELEAAIRAERALEKPSEETQKEDHHANQTTANTANTANTAADDYANTAVDFDDDLPF